MRERGLVAVAADRIRALPLTLTEMITNRLQFPFVRTQFLTREAQVLAKFPVRDQKQNSLVISTRACARPREVRVVRL
jgi:hypothetical protein